MKNTSRIYLSLILFSSLLASCGSDISSVEETKESTTLEESSTVEVTSLDETTSLEESSSEESSIEISSEESSEEVSSFDYATTPTLNEDKTQIEYGLYPQSHVQDEELLSQLNELEQVEENGYYLFEGEYYCKEKAGSLAPSSQFDDGTLIQNQNVYWFKCEPIVWNILSSNDGYYSLLSSILLDAACFYSLLSERQIEGETIYSNNYEYSDIREWLNHDFYESAFCLDDTYIKTTTVDNSAITTGSGENNFACNNTSDKVYLLSIQDYNNTSLGFEDSTSRLCKCSDYARVRGVYYNMEEENLFYAGYWTRSPLVLDPGNAWSIDEEGKCNSFYRVDYSNLGVRPVIRIQL